MSKIKKNMRYYYREPKGFNISFWACWPLTDRLTYIAYESKKRKKEKKRKKKKKKGGSDINNDIKMTSVSDEP